VLLVGAVDGDSSGVLLGELIEGVPGGALAKGPVECESDGGWPGGLEGDEAAGVLSASEDAGAVLLSGRFDGVMGGAVVGGLSAGSRGAPDEPTAAVTGDFGASAAVLAGFVESAGLLVGR
jgi:hypothetical protein